MFDELKYEWKRRGASYTELWFGGRLIVKVINKNEYVVRAVKQWRADGAFPTSGSELYEAAKSLAISGGRG